MYIFLKINESHVTRRENRRRPFVLFLFVSFCFVLETKPLYSVSPGRQPLDESLRNGSEVQEPNLSRTEVRLYKKGTVYQ